MWFNVNNKFKLTLEKTEKKFQKKSIYLFNIFQCPNTNGFQNQKQTSQHRISHLLNLQC